MLRPASLSAADVSCKSLENNSTAHHDRQVLVCTPSHTPCPSPHPRERVRQGYGPGVHRAYHHLHKSLDIVNPAGPEEYPSSMRIQAGVAYDLDWKPTEGGAFDLSSKVAAPIAAAAGVDVGFNAGVAFKHSVSRCWEFERLETSYVNMTQSYLDDTMDSPEVESYVKRHKQYGVVNPSLFVITGIMTGRKATLSETETKERSGIVETTVGAGEIAEVGGGVGASRNMENSISQRVDDLVFAIRVAKVTKGFFERDWCWETLSGGATFAAGKEEAKAERIKSVKAQLEAHGYTSTEIIGLEEGGEDVFVL